MKVKVSKNLRETLAKLGLLPTACNSREWEEIHFILSKVAVNNRSAWLNEELVRAISIACAEIENIIEILVKEEYENAVKNYWAEA